MNVKENVANSIKVYSIILHSGISIFGLQNDCDDTTLIQQAPLLVYNESQDVHPSGCVDQSTLLFSDMH